MISAVIVLGAAIVVACGNSNSAKKDVEPQCDTAKIEVEEVVDTLADIERPTRLRTVTASMQVRQV